MTEVLAGLLILFAGVFSVAAALGVLRFPDALSRMHAASIATAFAALLALAAAAVALGGTGTAVRAVLATLFIFLTAPIGAHLLGRSNALRTGAISSNDPDLAKRDQDHNRSAND